MLARGLKLGWVDRGLGWGGDGEGADLGWVREKVIVGSGKRVLSLNGSLRAFHGQSNIRPRS